jgi:hypothetical protein
MVPGGWRGKGLKKGRDMNMKNYNLKQAKEAAKRHGIRLQDAIKILAIEAEERRVKTTSKDSHEN